MTDRKVAEQRALVRNYYGPFPYYGKPNTDWHMVELCRLVNKYVACHEDFVYRMINPHLNLNPMAALRSKWKVLTQMNHYRLKHWYWRQIPV